MADILRNQTSYFRPGVSRREPVQLDESPDPIGRHLYSMVYYDSLIFLHYREQWEKLQAIRRGTFWIPIQG